MFYRIICLYAKCICLRNQPSFAIPIFTNVSHNDPLYCPFAVSIETSGGNGNTVANPYV